MNALAERAHFSVAVFSTVGLAADRNEDAVGIDGFVMTTQATHTLTFQLDAAAPHTFVVADGMGGRAAGDRASAIAAQEISSAANGVGQDGIDGEGLLVQAVHRARAALDSAAHANPSLDGFGTTAVALHRDPSGDVTVLQIGDSMAYRFVDGYLGAVSSPARSTDPSTRGKLTDHLGAGQLNRALPETVLLRARPGSRFVLCTDGVWDTAEASAHVFEQLESRLRMPDLTSAAEATLEFVFSRGATDNATGVIIDIAAPAETER